MGNLIDKVTEKIKKVIQESGFSGGEMTNPLINRLNIFNGGRIQSVSIGKNTVTASTVGKIVPYAEFEQYDVKFADGKTMKVNLTIKNEKIVKCEPPLTFHYKGSKTKVCGKQQLRF